MKRIVFFLVCACLSAAVPAAAQDDEALYMEQAGGAAILFRGHCANIYPIAYNGTYFWDGPAFGAGTINYNGRSYRNIRLNVDAVRQDLLIKSVTGLDKVIPREYVERFSFDGRPFLNLQRIYGPDAPDGYWEVLYDGRAKVIKQVSRALRKDVDGSLWAQTGYDEKVSTTGPLALMTFVRTVRYCYISEDGTIVPVRKRGEILRYYKDRKREIKRHISNMETARRMNFERFAVESVQFAESR